MNKLLKGAADKSAYHHGDLRAALLEAAEKELAENGIEKFSLRAVAKRAGVSHAAPAHHFHDVNGLLTALAALAFRRFVGTQQTAMESAAQEPRAQLCAAGVGYVRFALANPALFRLAFSSDRPNFDHPELQAAAREGYEMLVRQVRAVTGTHTPEDADTQRNVDAAWASAHGLADLLASGRLKELAAMPQDDRENAIREIINRAVPEGRI